MSASPTAPFPWRKYWLRFGITLAVMLLPFAPAVWAGLQASAHACSINEGVVTPCIIDGVDQGEALHGLFVTGWFGAIACGIGFWVLLGFIVQLYRELGRWGRM